MKKLIILLFAIFMSSCLNQVNEKDFKNKSQEIIGVEKYKNIYCSLEDSLEIWVLNSLIGFEAEKIYLYKIDSLLCFNKTKNRFISCRHLYVNISDATSDDLQFVYGEEIQNKWYFFKGASIVIPRDMLKGQDKNTPFNYNQMHQIALKELYSGYLKSNGEINEEWFTRHFEGPGWVNWNDTPQKIKSYTRKDYEKFHLEVVRNNWNGINKDSIKQLPSKNAPLP